MEITCGIYLFNVRIRKILICHATHARWNSWTIPKGVKNKDEDSFAAAIREMWEETGLEFSKLHVIKKHRLPPVSYLKQRKVLESFLVITDTEIENFHFHCNTLINNAYPEIDKWKWIDVTKEKDLLHETQQQNIKQVKKMIKNYFQNAGVEKFI